jgi:DHA3 family tetracycline resistance protein-like MFS transporter
VHGLDARRFYLGLNAASGASTGLVFVPVMVFQIVQVRLAPLELVLIGTALELTIFVFQVPTGAMADTFGRRLSMCIGYAFVGAGFLLMAVPSFAAIAAGSATWGLGYCFISGAEEAWIAGELGSGDLPRLFTRAGQVNTVASLAVLPVAVLIATRAPSLPIVIGGLIAILMALAVGLALPEMAFVRSRTDQHPIREVLRTAGSGARAVRSNQVLVRLVAATLFVGLCSEGFDRLNGAHLLRDAGFSNLPPLPPVAWIGAIEMGRMVLGLGAQELVRRRIGEDPDSRTAGTITTALVTAQILAMSAFALTRQPLLALVTVMLVMIARQTYGPLYTAWVAREADPEVRATVISLDGQLNALGEVAGGPVVGLLGNAYSLRIALLATTAFLAPAVPLLFSARTRLSPPVASEIDP